MYRWQVPSSRPGQLFVCTILKTIDIISVSKQPTNPAQRTLLIKVKISPKIVSPFQASHRFSSRYHLCYQTLYQCAHACIFAAQAHGLLTTHSSSCSCGHPSYHCQCLQGNAAVSAASHPSLNTIVVETSAQQPQPIRCWRLSPGCQTF
jgi:hypothetical protein